MSSPKFNHAPLSHRLNADYLERCARADGVESHVHYEHRSVDVNSPIFRDRVLHFPIVVLEGFLQLPGVQINNSLFSFENIRNGCGDIEVDVLLQNPQDVGFCLETHPNRRQRIRRYLDYAAEVKRDFESNERRRHAGRFKKDDTSSCAHQSSYLEDIRDRVLRLFTEPPPQPEGRPKVPPSWLKLGQLEHEVLNLPPSNQSAANQTTGAVGCNGGASFFGKMKQVRYCVNVDLEEDRRWKGHVNELGKKLPKWCWCCSDDDVLRFNRQLVGCYARSQFLMIDH